MAVVLPAIERLGRFALNRRGLASRHVHTRIGRVHAYDGRGRGALPPTLVMHGLGSAATPFGGVLARLQERVRRVVAPELPGHGFSEAPREPLTPELLFETMRGVFDTLVDEPFVVCGNSLGGILAMRFAIERPDRVRALVLVSPAGARLPEHELETVKKRFDVRSRRETLALMKRLYHRPPWFLPLVAGDIQAMMRRPVVRDILAHASPEHGPAPEELAALPMPVLLLWGRSERLLPARSLDYFREALPKHAVIEEPEGKGHCPHFDDPAWVASRILRFADEARA
jgi:pimeloyl-ACP methyl ester carboxylesterase